MLSCLTFLVNEMAESIINSCFSAEVILSLCSYFLSQSATLNTIVMFFAPTCVGGLYDEVLTLGGEFKQSPRSLSVSQLIWKSDSSAVSILYY